MATELDVSHNRLVKIENLNCCSKMFKLNLSHNVSLRDIGVLIAPQNLLRSLKDVNLEFTAQEAVPKEVMEQSTRAVATYLRELSKVLSHALRCSPPSYSPNKCSAQS